MHLSQLAHKTALVYTLLGIVFIATLWVIAYHFHILHLAKSAKWLKVKEQINSWFHNYANASQPTIGDVPESSSSHDPHRLVTKTIFELREPLLDTDSGISSKNTS